MFAVGGRSRRRRGRRMMHTRSPYCVILSAIFKPAPALFTAFVLLYLPPSSFLLTIGTTHPRPPLLSGISGQCKSFLLAGTFESSIPFITYLLCPARLFLLTALHDLYPTGHPRNLAASLHLSLLQADYTPLNLQTPVSLNIETLEVIWHSRGYPVGVGTSLGRNQCILP